MRRGAWIAVVLAGLPASAAAQEIRPGDVTSTGCTMGFVYDGAGAHAGVAFTTIAAHCVDRPEQEVGIAGTDGDATDWLGGDVYEPLGHVVIPGDANVAKTDVALVEVLGEVAPRLASGVRGHEQWPARVAAAADMRAGDALQHSGWGTATFATETTRQERQGIYRGEDDGAWQGISPVTSGDSGSPVVHVASGGAVGIAKGYRCGEDLVYVCGMHGPTVQSTVQLAAAHGIQIVMRVAGAGAPSPAPPPASEPPPPPATSPPPRCVDDVAPASGLSAGRLRLRGGRVRLGGWARDGGCGGLVARVELRLAATGAGLQGAAWRTASGTTRWRFRFRARRPGRYRVQVRATDAAGNREPPRRPVTVRVRR